MSIKFLENISFKKIRTGLSKKFKKIFIPESKFERVPDKDTVILSEPPKVITQPVKKNIEIPKVVEEFIPPKINRLILPPEAKAAFEEVETMQKIIGNKRVYGPIDTERLEKLKKALKYENAQGGIETAEEHEKIISLLETAIKKETDEKNIAGLRYKLGEAYLDKGSYHHHHALKGEGNTEELNATIEAHKNALDLLTDKKNTKEINKELGTLYGFNKDYDNAILSYEKALELETDPYWRYSLKCDIGNAHADNENYIEAKKVFEDALKTTTGRNNKSNRAYIRSRIDSLDAKLSETSEIPYGKQLTQKIDDLINPFVDSSIPSGKRLNEDIDSLTKEVSAPKPGTFPKNSQEFEQYCASIKSNKHIPDEEKRILLDEAFDQYNKNSRKF